MSESFKLTMFTYKTTIYEPVQGHKALLEAWNWVKPMVMAGHRLNVVIKPETRSLAQNNLMWSCLTDLSTQLQWCGKKMTPEGWKDFITAHIDGQDIVPNMDGTGFVTIGRGKSTSQMTIKEMTEVIELCHAFGADKNVKWSKTSIGRDDERLAA
jgi:hypothetical protein